jgi:hypothetical protein
MSKLTTIAGLKSVVVEIGSNDLMYGLFNLFIGSFVILLLTLVQNRMQNHSISSIVANKPLAIRWGFYMLLIFAILLIGVYEEQEFIYFQF